MFKICWVDGTCKRVYFFVLVYMVRDISTLLENMFSTSVIYDFLYQFITDVESADVECIIVNIGSKKLMLTLNLQHRLFK